MNVFGMPETQITEECSCGAKFKGRGLFVTSAAAEWRTNHVCRRLEKPTTKENA